MRNAHMKPFHASLTISRWVNLFLSATTANAKPARTPSGSRTGCVKPSRCGTRRSIGKTAPKAHSDTQSTKGFLETVNGVDHAVDVCIIVNGEIAEVRAFYYPTQP